MNPLTNMKNIKKLSEQELQTNYKSSWHDQYRDSAWIFVGGLPYDLTEGDIIAIFSQYGEIVNINLVRDKETGKSKGFAFICYEDQRSTVLAVDNFNGIKVLGRILRVDHVSEYKVPKEGKSTDEETKRLYREGCAPKATPKKYEAIPVVKVEPDDVRETLADQISGEIKLPQRLPIYPIKQEKMDEEIKQEEKSSTKRKLEKQKKSDESSDSDSELGEKKKKSKHKKKKKSKKRHKDDSDDCNSTHEKRKSIEKSYHKIKKNSSNERHKRYEDTKSDKSKNSGSYYSKYK